MKSITFYSYKGGVGRTLAATNFAVYLAKLGLKVVIMDFDLDAPGVDSKFPNFTLPSGQLGLIDYILCFQREGAAPGAIDEIFCEVPISSPRQEYTLGLIPAGDYLADDYSAKLNELDWRAIFSDRRDGVAFFQLFLDRINDEISPDVLVIDSRTGFSEIGGLCTQQLADETVILSSLASESVKMTSHLARLIRESNVARQLNREVDTKVVVCRVPKPQDVEKLKIRCCEQFGVEETSLFFLFSCPGLESEEFVAMLDTEKEEALVASYIQLFQGLNIEVAQRSIQEEIEQAEKALLSSPFPGKEAEAKIRELVALYPHPEVYRRAMRFFELTRRPDEASSFGVRLLDLVPDDTEAQLQVARFVLHNDVTVRHGFMGRPRRKLPEAFDMRRLIDIAARANESEVLSVRERVRLADLLEDFEQFSKSYQIASECLESGELDDEDVRINALGIAARTAMQLGKKEIVQKLIAEIPIRGLQGRLASVAVDLKIASGDKDGAFELAKLILSREFVPNIMVSTAELAQELGRIDELEEIIRMNPEIAMGAMDAPQIRWELERFGLDFSELGERFRNARRKRRRN